METPLTVNRVTDKNNEKKAEKRAREKNRLAIQKATCSIALELVYL